jgi:hypothetical protein
MKYIKFLLVNIVVFAVFFFLLSLLFPSKVSTSKTINVAAAQKNIAAKLQNIFNWKTWNEFVKENNIKPELVNNYGDSLITVNLMAADGKKLETVFGIVDSFADSTALNFQIIHRAKWYKPWEKFALLLSEKKFGLPMEMSLANFKKEIEADTLLNRGN